MTTKEQERKALEQIKNILSTLDSDGWVNTAFEGCVRDAEENIENDFAVSMHGRWQDAEQKIQHLSAELTESQEQARAANERAERYSKSHISAEVLASISSVLQYHNQIKYVKEIDECNSIIIQHADNPDSDDFRAAVARRKLAQRSSDRVNDLVSKIEAARLAE